MEVNICYCRHMDKEMKDNIIIIIKNSFKQTDERKTVYISNQLKEIYNNEDWNVLFFYQKENVDYSYKCFGSIFICKYNDRRIIIYPSKIEEDTKEEEKEKETKKTIEKYKTKIEALKIRLNENNLKLEYFQKMLHQKENEIENLKVKMLSYNGNNPFNKTFYSRDQMLALNFISSDQKLHFALPCIKKDLFVDIEKKLYDKFPEYKETNNNFLVNARIILRFKTVEENKLDSGIPILIIPNKNK